MQYIEISGNAVGRRRERGPGAGTGRQETDCESMAAFGSTCVLDKLVPAFASLVSVHILDLWACFKNALFVHSSTLVLGPAPLQSKE